MKKRNNPKEVLTYISEDDFKKLEDFRYTKRKSRAEFVRLIISKYLEEN